MQAADLSMNFSVRPILLSSDGRVLFDGSPRSLVSGSCNKYGQLENETRLGFPQQQARRVARSHGGLLRPSQRGDRAKQQTFRFVVSDMRVVDAGGADRPCFTG